MFQRITIKSSFALIYCVFFLLLSCKESNNDRQNKNIDATDQVEENNSEQEDQKRNILFFGNSLTAGLGLPEEEAYPSLIQDRIDSLGLDYNVINAGLSGETSSGGLERIDWVLNQPVAIFLLELGANDMLRGLDVQSTKENLNQILKKVRTTYPDTKIIVAGMQAAPNMGPDYIRNFNNIYPDLASSFEASLIPFFLEGVAGVDSLNLQDRKHPNAKGQKVVMENVWKELYPLL